MTLLRTDPEQEPEIWCRCDGGPHGFLSIAAHAHADALSVEVRYGGRRHPGRSGHLLLPRRARRGGHTSARRSRTTPSSSAAGTSPARAVPSCGCGTRRAAEIEVTDDGDIASWTAEHDGYASLDPPATASPLGPAGPGLAQCIDIIDEIEGGRHDLRLAFHFGPEVEAELDEALRGPALAARTRAGAARLELPPQLRWSLHRGETDPILGWYSPGLGRRVPAFTLVGRGRPGPGELLRTRLTFTGEAVAPIPDASAHAISWDPSASTGGIPTGLGRRPHERASARPAGDPCVSRGGTRPSSASWRRSGSSSVPGTPRSTRRC